MNVSVETYKIEFRLRLCKLFGELVTYRRGIADTFDDNRICDR